MWTELILQHYHDTHFTMSTKIFTLKAKNGSQMIFLCFVKTKSG